MIQTLKQWLTPPVLPDEDQTRIGTQIIVICAGMIVISLMAAVFDVFEMATRSESTLLADVTHLVVM
jgi:hypothetical protein